MKLDTLDEVLDFAIRQEEHAGKFYTDLADNMDHEHMKATCPAFADEEKTHQAKLIGVKEGKVMLTAKERVLDLKIGDYLEEVTLSADLDYKDALVLAMKAEKAAFKLYRDLASATDDAGLKQTLLTPAQEEAKQKLRFEIEYDDNFLREN